METSYVMGVDGAYRITASRVSLDSVVYDFLSGLSPERIADNYDTLTLEQVYGAITYYLAHRTEVDATCSETMPSLTTCVSKRVQLTHSCIRSLKKYQRFGLEGSVSSRCRSVPTIIAGLRRRELTIDLRTLMMLVSLV